MAGIRAAIDVQDFAGDEVCFLEEQHRLDDVMYFAHSSDRVQTSKERVRLQRLHRRLDDTRADRIYPNPLAGELDRQRAGDGVQTALCQRGQRRSHRGNRLIGKRSRNIDDMAGAGLQHPGRGPLRDMEESMEVDPAHQGKIFQGVRDERLRDENSSVVH